jgi:formamidopyrimidine-DNA glycosylase
MMIELPEATTIARQISAQLKEKRILEGSRGNSPHKFAFYNREPEEYAAILPGKVIGEAGVNGPLILAAIEPGFTLILGGGGERIVYHPDASTLPKKYQLSLRFTDETYLTVSVQGWGSVLLMNNALPPHQFVDLHRPAALSPEFSQDYFKGLFDELPPADPRSVKYFMISKPGVLGVGNGCLQDILWHARIHPRRRAVELSRGQQLDLYHATRDTLQEMIEHGGRDGDYDLYDCPGGYKRILHSKTAGTPCRNCGTTIEKAAYLGGAVYFCPRCQL